MFSLFQLLLGSRLRIHAGVLFRWIHPFLWIVSLESLEVRTLWSSGKRIGSVIAYTATTYWIGRCLKTVYVSPLCRPDNLCPVPVALSRSVRIFRYILQKSMVPVAPFDRKFEMARHRVTSVGGASGSRFRPLQQTSRHRIHCGDFGLMHRGHQGGLP